MQWFTDGFSTEGEITLADQNRKILGFIICEEHAFNIIENLIKNTLIITHIIINIYNKLWYTCYKEILYIIHFREKFLFFSSLFFFSLNYYWINNEDN